MAVPPHDFTPSVRKAIQEAKGLVGLLQGTMSLEGQGLDRVAMRQVKKRMIRRLLRSAP